MKNWYFHFQSRKRDINDIKQECFCNFFSQIFRDENIKIDSNKLRERSGTKKATFDRLLAELQKYTIGNRNTGIVNKFHFLYYYP